jgi:hypothetical protein
VVAPVHICGAGVETEGARPHLKAMTIRPKPRPRRSRKDDRLRLDARLDEALLETFPASDPIAVGLPTSTERPRRPIGRKAPAVSLGSPAGGAPRTRATA